MGVVWRLGREPNDQPSRYPGDSNPWGRSRRRRPHRLLLLLKFGWLAQLGEHCLYKAGVAGSSPVPPTNFVLEVAVTELFDFLRSVGFWIFIIVLFGGGSALYAPVKKCMDQRHERKMKELEIREKEVTVKLEHKRTTGMPDYFDKEDPRQVQAWEEAEREANNLAARAASAQKRHV